MNTKALGTTAGPSKVDMKGSPIGDEAPSLATAFSCSCLASDWPSLTAASDPIARDPLAEVGLQEGQGVGCNQVVLGRQVLIDSVGRLVLGLNCA